MLILDNVSVKRANRLLFQPVSCVIKPGEILTLQGESGRGKSTLLHALIHEEPQVELVGQVRLDGQCMNMSDRLSECAQTVFQDPMLFSHLSVGANIALSMHRLPRSEHGYRINALLNQLGLDGMAREDPFCLSRGQMMRVAVARALAPHPRLLLLDEPFSALDTETREQVKTALFGQIKNDQSYGILVTHHVEDRPPKGECVCLMPSLSNV